MGNYIFSINPSEDIICKGPIHTAGQDVTNAVLDPYKGVLISLQIMLMLNKGLHNKMFCHQPTI